MKRLRWLWLALALLWAMPGWAHDTVYYYYTNTLHSAVVETDAQGNIVEQTTYYAPYGQVLNRSLRDGPGYTGHEEDPATGLNYMQQRYYDPQSGRFVSTDPVLPTDDGENFNRYRYANDNPYRYMDPDGRQLVLGGGALAACIESGACEAAAYALLGAAAAKKAVDEAKTRQDHIMWSRKSRSKPPPPLPGAQGRPHSIPDGKGGYTSYPSGKSTEGKQYRPTGRPHGNIPRPNVKEWKPTVGPNGEVHPGKPIVRPPEPHEVPSQPPPPPPPPPKTGEGG